MRPVPDLPVVFTADDLRRRGVTQEQAEYRVSRHVWHRLRRGVYCREADWAMADAEGRHVLAGMALVLAADAPGPLVLSHTTAAVVHGLPVSRAALRRVAVTSRPGTRRTSTEDRHLHLAALDDVDVTLRRGVPVTTVPRTVADCLRHLPPGDGVAVADAAVHHRLITVEQVRAVLHRQARWPFAHVAALALPLVDGRRESRLESRSAVVMAAHGLPPAVPQCRILDERGTVVARVDFGWPELGVVGEADGRTKYGSDAARRIEADRDRQALLENLGLVVVRWDERHLYGIPPVLVTRLREGFARADGRRFRGRAA